MGDKTRDKSVTNYCVANHQREVKEFSQLSGGKQTSENDQMSNGPTAQHQEASAPASVRVHYTFKNGPFIMMSAESRKTAISVPQPSPRFAAAKKSWRSSGLIGEKKHSMNKIIWR